MDLHNVRLVVLAACGTLQGRGSRQHGLGGALLRAGAHGVIGTLWPVKDELTTPLMVEFHRHYRQSGDPAAALRRAQFAMLHSKDPRLQSPAAWAGFEYVSR